jgi:tRNA(fMet)-specific endonuclease VapC
VAVLYPDDVTTVHYASIYLQLRRQGTPIPTNDMWIASLCLQHELTLYARDSHFDHLPQLSRL